MSNKKDYPKPALTVDIVCFSSTDHDLSRHHSKVLLIKRKNEPFKDCWALPGGYVNEGETSLEAAIRELYEETKLVISQNYGLTGVYDKPGRDPRGWVVSVAYFTEIHDLNTARAGDDAAEVGIFDVDNLPEMAFDHADIIDDTFDRFAT